MRITFDPAKRDRTLAERGLDFTLAAEVFAAPFYTEQDSRQDYGETRWISAGWLRGRMVMVVWTERGDAVHVISMRKANAREQRRYAKYLG
ncbi:hypothetical protein BZG35_13695 [Brevundimonas sp. LM2]|uniref:BrnT family toxin n=1 Tax=Brevundimonas sp. LM2 TaxID=1938605 RepID=UPI000983F621|nr:BrnT family toxin [Brevundimonas sp. LM2]AQR62583.1 hypothetical protein BZG35_13695 [Brevundimonas sp. LM2]